jgi:ATP-dependent DNA ligase
MIPQCKGKDYEKVPVSKILKDGWYASIKYDGNYVQVHKKGNEVKFFTSGGKQFYHTIGSYELTNLNPDVDFILECEYISNSSGLLGSRTKAAKLTSYRTNFSKGIANVGLGESKDKLGKNYLVR